MSRGGSNKIPNKGQMTIPPPREVLVKDVDAVQLHRHPSSIDRWPLNSSYGWMIPNSNVIEDALGLFELEYSASAFPRTDIWIVRHKDYRASLNAKGFASERVSCSSFVLERPYGDIWQQPDSMWFRHPGALELQPIDQVEEIKFDVDGMNSPRYGRLSLMLVECQFDDSVLYKSVFHHFEAPLQSSSTKEVHLQDSGKVTSQSWRNPWRPPMRWEILASESPSYVLGESDLKSLMHGKHWIPVNSMHTDQWPVMILDVRGEGDFSPPSDWIVSSNTCSSGLDLFTDLSLALLHGIDKSSRSGCGGHRGLLSMSLLSTASARAEVLDSGVGTSVPFVAFAEGYWTGYLIDDHLPAVDFGRRYTWDVNGVELHSARAFCGEQGDSHLIKDLTRVIRDFHGWPGVLFVSLRGETMNELLKHEIFASILARSWSMIALASKTNGIRLADDLQLRYPHFVDLIKSNYATLDDYDMPSSPVDLHRLVLSILRREWPRIDQSEEVKRSVMPLSSKIVSPRRHSVPILPDRIQG
eukprot:GHVH01016595.1.p1 GENE.GHVH01016595.1~~GHVH01016595.1.p1  ORF type:complete len:527 (+),score=68.47 GHVH01016595.1:116-1696(+)